MTRGVNAGDAEGVGLGCWTAPAAGEADGDGAASSWGTATLTDNRRTISARGNRLMVFIEAMTFV
jgi:hypothetical protein